MFKQALRVKSISEIGTEQIDLDLQKFEEMEYRITTRLNKLIEVREQDR